MSDWEGASRRVLQSEGAGSVERSTEYGLANHGKGNITLRMHRNVVTEHNAGR